MRLTPQVVEEASSFTNALRQRELDLRGHRIPVIENLGVTRDQNDVLDLTENELTSISNFPKLARLKMLLLARNRISHFSKDISQTLPNIECLGLASNNFNTLAALAPLRSFRHLKAISLIDNPITVMNAAQYRSWVIWLCPQLRILDFQLVRLEERNLAIRLFGGSWDTKSKAASDILEFGETSLHINGTGPNTEQYQDNTSINDEKERLLKALQAAASLDEIQMLEQQLQLQNR